MASQEGRTKGWIALWRKLVDSEIWEQEPWRLKAWLYMLLEANHKDDDQRKLRRGQLLVPTIEQFSEALRWKRGRQWNRPTREATKTFWLWLRERGMITTSRTTRGTVITIVNYAAYQRILPEVAGDRTTDATTTTGTNGQPTSNRQPPTIDNKETTQELNQQQHAAAIKSLEARYGPDIRIPIHHFGLPQVVDAVRITEARMEEGEAVKNKIGLIIHLCKQCARWSGSEWQLHQAQREIRGRDRRRELVERNRPLTQERRVYADQRLQEMRQSLSEKLRWET